jgi:hypothetical protein
MPLTDTKTSATDPATATSSRPHPHASSRPSTTRPRARGDLGSEPVERLEAEVIDLSARLAPGTYELLVLVGELDHRGSWAIWGALSCAAWLAAHLTEANVDDLPAIAAATPAGRLGAAIDASPRRRLPTRRQQRVLDQIDPECRQPGCHATAFLQYDHIEPYARGGPTILANLQRLCGPHNRARTGAAQPPEQAQ